MAGSHRTAVPVIAALTALWLSTFACGESFTAGATAGDGGAAVTAEASGGAGVTSADGGTAVASGAGGGANSGASGGVGAMGAGGMGVGGSGGNAAAMCVPVTDLAASVAECLNLAQSGATTAACAAIFPDELFIDNEYSGDLEPYHAFLRFELGDQPAPTSVASLVLTAVVTTDGSSDASGEIWRTHPFTFADLQAGDPGNVGTQPIAAAVGAVASGQVVQWSLPASAIHDDGNLYLSIRPTSTDGVRYWSNSGTTPVTLTLTCTP
jgi:hypothetical protein